MALGASVYKLVFDSNALTSLTPTRRELALAKQIMQETRPVAQQYGDQLDVLNQQLNKGLIEVQDYHRAHAALKAELPQNVAAQSALDEQLRISEQIRRSLMTAEEQEAAALNRANAAVAGATQLKEAGILAEQDYLSHLQLISSTMPEVVAAERARQQVQREAAEASAKLASDIGQSVQRLTEEKETFGLTAQEVELYKLAKRGASETDLEHIRTLQQEVAQLEMESAAQTEAAAAIASAAEATMRAEADAQAYVATLTEQRDTFHMTRNEVELYRLAEQGASEATLAEARSIQTEIAALERQQAEAAAAKQAETALAQEKEKVHRDTDQLIASMRTEIATMGMGANEARVFALAERGLSGEALNAARALAVQADSIRRVDGTQLLGIGQQALGAVPGLGGLSSAFTTLNPLMIGGGLAAAGIAAEFRIVTGAAHTLADTTREQWKEISTLATTAQSIGAEINTIVAFRDAMQDATGLDASSSDASLKKMLKTIGEAEHGSKKAAEAFGDLGLDAAKLAGMSTDQQIGAIADAFKKIPTEAEQARLVTRLFGSEGVTMLPLLRQGAAALEEAAARQRELGNTLSDLDAGKVLAMNEAWGDVGDVTAGIVRTLAVDLAPTMEAIATEVIEALKPGATIGDGLRTALEVIPPIIGYAADQTNRWVGMLELATAEAQRPFVAIVQGMAAADRATASFRLTKPNEELQVFAETYSATVGNLTQDALKRIEDGTSGAISNALSTATQPAARETFIETETAETTHSLLEEADKLTKSLLEQEHTMGMNKFSAQAWKLEQQAAALAVGQVTDDVKNQIDALNAQADKLQEIGAMDEARKQAAKDENARAAEVKRLTDAYQEAANTIGKTKEQVELWKLANMGATPAQLGQIEALQMLEAVTRADNEAQKEATELAKKHNDEIAKYRAELQKQIDTVGMTADQVKLYEFAKKGATAAELEQIAALQKEAAAHDALNRVSTSGFAAMAQGSREAFESLERARRANFLQGELGTTPPAFTVTPGATSAPFSVTAPIALPRAPDTKSVLDESLRTQKQIVKNTARPAIVVEEVTL